MHNKLCLKNNQTKRGSLNGKASTKWLKRGEKWPLNMLEFSHASWLSWEISWPACMTSVLFSAFCVSAESLFTNESLQKWYVFASIETQGVLSGQNNLWFKIIKFLLFNCIILSINNWWKSLYLITNTYKNLPGMKTARRRSK